MRKHLQQIVDRLLDLNLNPNRERSGDTGASVDAENETDQEEAPTPVSDEAQVMRILIKHDGWVRQSVLVEEVPWSRTRTNGVLSQMDADGEIRITETNNQTVIARPGYEPTGYHDR